MSRLKQLSLSITTNLLTQGLSLVLGLIALPIYIHSLGQSGYGVYSFLFVLIVYLNFLDLGLNGGVVRFISEAWVKKDITALNNIVSTTLKLYGITSILGMLILYFLADYLVYNYLKEIPIDLQDEALMFFKLGAFSFLLNLLLIFLSAIPTGIQKQYLSNSVRFSGEACRYLFGIILLLNGYGLIELIISNMIIQFASLFIIGWLIKKEIPEISFVLPFNHATFRKMLNYSIYLMVAAIMGVLALQINQLLIPFFISVSVLAIYATAYDTTGKLILIPKNIISPLFPLWTEMRVNGEVEKIKQLLFASQKLITVLILPLVFILSLEQHLIFSFWINEQFSEQVSVVFQYVLFSFVIHILTYSFTPLAFSYDIPRYHTIAISLQAVMMLFGSLVLIPIMGISGAGLSLFISQLIVSIGSGIFILRNTIRISFWTYTKEVNIFPVIIFILLLITHYVFQLFISDNYGFILTGILSLLLIIILWFFHIPKTDKELVYKYLPMRKNR